MKKKISYFSDATDKRLGIMAIGSRENRLPPEAVVSVTIFEGLAWWRFFINALLSQWVGRQMIKAEGLLYAEMGGRLGQFSGVTISVWEPKSMVRFRDSGAHGTSMKKFRWIFAGNAQTYFLTFKSNGRIPNYKEAYEVGKTHGRHFSGNKLIRNASKPIWEQEENRIS